MIKKILAVAIIASVVLTISVLPSAYPQANEFRRLRATSYGTPLTQPYTALSGESTGEYYIAAGDKLDVFVWQNPDFPKEVLVRPDGKISYPLLGTIKVKGMSIEELEATIKDGLAKYIRFPQVTVTLVESAGNKIIVLGQVQYPGVYTFSGEITVFEAIAMAGDFLDPPARRDNVIVVSDNLTENPKVRKLDLLSGIRDGTSSRDFIIHPNDLVYVPRNTIGDFNKFLAEIAPTISTISNICGMGTSLSGVAREGRAWFLHRDVKVVSGN